MPSRGRRAAATLCTLALAGSLATVLGAGAPAANAAASGGFTPGDLVVSRLHYTGTPGMIVPGKTVLPTGVTAIADGSFAQVWDNVNVDGNFGVAAPIYLDQLDPSGKTVSSVPAPDGTPSSNGRGHDVLSGSFSSKSEGALNLSTDGTKLTFMGYVTAPNTLDASNGNTPGVFDPTNPDAQSVYRAVGEVDAQGKYWVTETNAYSGDNGRAAILDSSTGKYYTAGNSNNGSGTSVPGVIYGTGAQLVTPAGTPENAQNPGQPTPVGGFSVSQLGISKADKLGKDTNFAAVAIHNGVVYYTKGSGSNGVNTVYFVDPTGTACPNGGVGLPVPGAPTPSTPASYNPTTGQVENNMCILKGFPTGLAKNISTPDVGAPSNTSSIGAIWFANDTTMYLADAGNGDDTYAGGVYTGAAEQNLAGIQKWSLVNGTWTYDYTLQSGLGLGKPYQAAGMPTGTNPTTGLPWAPGVDGVRNISGKVNADGSVTLYGVTSTVGGVTDSAADPNAVVTVTDQLGSTSVPSSATYHVLQSAAAGDVYRGTSLAPKK
ncbi:MAG: hypothetical protein ACTHON_11670 [Humibacter sp.]